MRKVVMGAVVCLSSVLGVGASSVFAGEVTGNGKGTPLPSQGPYAPEDNVAGDHEVMPASLCAYSGQNDEFHADPEGDWPRTQTFGGELRAFAEFYEGGVPGLAKDGIIKTGPGEACRGSG